MKALSQSDRRRLVLAAFAAGVAMPALAGAQTGTPAGMTPPPASDTEAAAGTVPTAGTPAQEGLQDIVVTARRVEERLQDVPLSISALSTRTLEDQQIRQVQDIGAQVPNVVTGRTSVPGAGQIAIRGVNGQSLPRPGLDNRVGVYLDGVYLARAQGQSFSLADIQRIEVLKGPQGTLFGRNVTAGSINIITAPPTGELGGTVEAGFGSRDRQRYRATLNLPSFGGLSIRGTYVHDRQNGPIRNLLAGSRIGDITVNVPAAAARPATATSDATLASDAFTQTFRVRPAAKRFGDRRADSGFLAARYEGVDNLTVDYKFDYAEETSTIINNIVGYSGAVGNGCVAAAIALGASVNQCGGTIAFNGGVISTPGTITNVGGANGYFVSTGAQNFSLGNQRPKVAAGEFNGPNFVRSWGHNLTAEYEAADALTLRSITAYRDLFSRTQADGDGGSFSLNNAFLTAVSPARYPASAYPAGGVTQFPLGVAIGSQKQHQFSQELQAFGKANDWLQYLVGLYYFREVADYTQVTVNSNAAVPASVQAAVAGPAGIPPYQPNGGDNIYGLSGIAAGDASHVTSSSKAIFGRVTITPVEQLDLVFGGRYTRDRKTGELPQFYANVLDFNPATTFREQVPTRVARNFEKFTYDATATWHVTRDINLYGRYATAYLAGGFLRNVPFDPETTKGAEIGIKSEFFDRKVRFNAAAFWQRSRNAQFTAIVTGLPAPVNTATVVRNLGSTKVKGVEAELTVAPFRGFTASGSFGYSDQSYFSPTVQIDRPQAAEWTVQGYAQYDTPPLFGDAFLSFRFDANYRSRYDPSINVAIQNTVPAATGGTLPAELLALYGYPNTPAGRIAYQTMVDKFAGVGGYWLANGRVSLSNIDMGFTKVRISGFVQNMFDEKQGKTYSAPYGINAGSTFVDARTFGIDLVATF